MLDVIQGKFWSQYVNFPTHEDGNLLDLVLGREGLVTGIWDEGMLGSGDHNMVKFEFLGPRREEDNKEMIPDWAKADMAGMRAAISEIDWDAKLEGMQGLETWEAVKKVIDDETDRCVPKKMRRVGTLSLIHI